VRLLKQTRDNRGLCLRESESLDGPGIEMIFFLFFLCGWFVCAPFLILRCCVKLTYLEETQREVDRRGETLEMPQTVA
jgi:hypothetical protein